MCVDFMDREVSFEPANFSRQNDRSSYVPSCYQSLVFDATYLSLVAYPILLAICTVGNALNIMVIYRSKKRHCKELLLTSLSITDTLVMWLTLPSYLDNHNAHFCFRHRGFLAAPDIELNGYHFMVDQLGCFKWLQYTFHYVSDGTVILFSCERLMAFRWSYLHRRYRSHRVMVLNAIVIISLFSAILCLEHLVAYYYFLNVNSRITLDTHDTVEPLWLARWINIQHVIDVVIPIINSLTILSINLWLLIFLKNSRDVSTHLRRHSREASRYRVNSESLLTNTPGKERTVLGHANDIYLLGCGALNLLTQLPAVIIHAIVLSHSGSGEDNWILDQLLPLAWILTQVNYSVDFLIYAGLSRRVRRMAKEALCRRPQNSTRSQERLSGSL